LDYKMTTDTKPMNAKQKKAAEKAAKAARAAAGHGPAPAPAQAPAAPPALPAAPPALPAPAPGIPGLTDEIRAALIAAGWRAPREGRAKAPAGPKRVSALDAAAQVLAESAEPMGAKALITAMSTKGLWESPGGATPDATLAAAIVREIQAKGDTARFIKVAPGMWIARAAA
jgi:hypothetical protein